MREIEKQRLTQLKTKQAIGSLTPAEGVRLVALEKLEKEDFERGKSDPGNNDTSGNGGGIAAGSASGDSDGITDGDKRSNGDIITSKRDKRPRRDEATTLVIRPNGQDTGRAGEDDVSGGNAGISCGSDADTKRKSNRGSGGSTRVVAGRDTGGNAESADGRSDWESKDNEEQNVITDLKPKPVRAKTAKKVKAGKPALGTELNADLISGLIQGGFSMIAVASKKPYWLISEEEAESIANPLETILNNLSAKQRKEIEKYSAPMLLVMAVVGVTAPRIMLEVATIKAQKGGMTSAGTHSAPDTNESDLSKDVRSFDEYLNNEG